MTQEVLGRATSTKEQGKLMVKFPGAPAPGDYVIVEYGTRYAVVASSSGDVWILSRLPTLDDAAMERCHAVIRDMYPSVDVIPTLLPMDHDEVKLSRWMDKHLNEW